MKQNNYFKDFKNMVNKIYVYLNNNFKFVNKKKI